MTGLPPVQAPCWQVSDWVQALPSLQAVPSGAAWLEHCPVPGLHVPATWHWSEAVHTTGLEPVHAPLWQVSVWVQALLSLQALPLGGCWVGAQARAVVADAGHVALVHLFADDPGAQVRAHAIPDHQVRAARQRGIPWTAHRKAPPP